jgi:ATP-dependent exoDNAse (exonuclease V) alpha subunit
LELAYALTIHKAQGSEFGITFVVVPTPCRLLSRELLYTALTRQRKQVVLLHQGDVRALLKLSSAEHSEMARRLTNLFKNPKPVEHVGKFL